MHIVLYSKDQKPTALFRDVPQLPAVDAGHGWLIFACLPAEAAFHDAEDNNKHELFFMCRIRHSARSHQPECSVSKW